jgi:hypothetical protein
VISGGRHFDHSFDMLLHMNLSKIILALCREETRQTGPQVPALIAEHRLRMRGAAVLSGHSAVSCITTNFLQARQVRLFEHYFDGARNHPAT